MVISVNYHRHTVHYGIGTLDNYSGLLDSGEYLHTPDGEVDRYTALSLAARLYARLHWLGRMRLDSVDAATRGRETHYYRVEPRGQLIATVIY